MPIPSTQTGVPLTKGSAAIAVTFSYLSPADGAVFFVADRAYTVVGITFRPLVTASSATAIVKKAPSGTAITGGTAIHQSTLALDATTNTNANPTLSATPADLDLAAGDALGVDCNGTTTNGTGVITVFLVPKS